MLKLKGITKQYIVGENTINALGGVDLEFRKSEFVAILGPSGCGKTTLLNIVGGLDKYTSGDLIINNKSTKYYLDSDWDSYRNHTIGFVFQSYNLIHHQTVLGNVELALTLSGISKADRKARAIKVLESVGLGDQIYKIPNQLSGGQMQRVAIARALVNDPDVILADEPTGALDSETSVQIMELLKEIAKNRLVIMVTHNPDLAKKYANRTIKLLDGFVLNDSNPYSTNNPLIENKKTKKSKVSESEKTSMSMFTAFGLSLRNLLTKRVRTLLIAFAGSIGIIGVALVLSVSNGFTGYIDKMQGDTLSAFPLTIEKSTYDFSSLMNMQRPVFGENYPTSEEIYINTIGENLMNSMLIENDISEEYITNVVEKINPEYFNIINYQYSVQFNIFKDTVYNDTTYYPQMSSSQWNELATNDGVNQYEFLETQYDVIGGSLPKDMNEIVLVVNSYNELTDLVIQSLGITIEKGKTKFSFDELIGLEYRLILNDEYYKFDGTKYVTNTLPFPGAKLINEELYNKESNDILTLKIVGIVRPNAGTEVGSITGSIGYTKALTDHVLDNSLKSNIVKYMIDNPTFSPFTGNEYVDTTGDNPVEIQRRNDLLNLGGDKTPNKINIYAKSFESKELIKDYLDEWNDLEKARVIDKYFLDEGVTRDTASEEQIKAAEALGKASGIYYTDLMGTVVSSMNTLVGAISIVLIVFTSISLVVSSIMIGVITHISVLERTKEIGVLRSIGARKKDISRIFNAEAIMIGFLAGFIGITVSLLIMIPLNIILESLTSIPSLAIITPMNVIILLAVSTMLTFVAGLLPAKAASHRDPVIALRNE